MEDLKKCPFCGGEAFMWSTQMGKKVSCESGCVTMPPRWDVSFTSEEQAIKAWNTRKGE